MDLALTESQEMLKGIAKSFMAREAPKDVIVGWENEPSGLIPELWKKACGLSSRPRCSSGSAGPIGW